MSGDKKTVPWPWPEGRLNVVIGGKVDKVSLKKRSEGREPVLVEIDPDEEREYIEGKAGFTMKSEGAE